VRLVAFAAFVGFFERLMMIRLVIRLETRRRTAARLRRFGAALRVREIFLLLLRPAAVLGLEERALRPLDWRFLLGFLAMLPPLRLV
jgi:hypothetical protein